MERRIIVPLVVSVLLLTLGTVAAACDSDEETQNGTTPAAAVTPDVTPEVTPEVTPDDTDENGAADGEGDEDPEAALRAEAEALCPAEFLDPCTESYIEFATGPLEAALCITPDGLWFMETPQGGVGDTCSAAEGLIVAIVGGE